MTDEQIALARRTVACIVAALEAAPNTSGEHRREEDK